MEEKNIEKGKNKNTTIENLVEEINDLMLSVSENENSDSGMMSDLFWLKDAIRQYSEYMDLKNKLLDYRKNHIQKTYTFTITNENKISGGQTETVGSLWEFAERILT